MLAAADDDDATFGDFKFASFPSPSPSPSPADDDWGDFVQSPLSFPPPAAAATGDAAFDPYAGFGPSTGTSSYSSSESRGKKVWERPMGAIPLSVFGEELVEGDSGDKELVFGGSYAFVKKGSVGQDGVFSSAVAAGESNFADLIANLYGDAAKVEGKREEGLKFDDLSNGDGIDESGWEFKCAGLLAGAHNGGVWEVDYAAGTLQNGEIKNELEVHQNHNIQSSAPANFNFQDSVVKVENGGPLDFTEEDIDDNDWIFKDALSGTGQQNGFVQDTKVSSNYTTGSARSTNFSKERINSFDLFHVPNASFFECENSTEKDLSGSTLSVDLMFGLERDDQRNSIATITEDIQNNEFDSFRFHSMSNVDYSKNNLYERSEFKSALEVKRVEEEISKSSSHQVHNNNTSIKKLDDFYSSLKEESRSLALNHLEDLKKKKVASALSGKDDEVVAMNEEIQMAYKKLQQENLASGKVHPVDLTSGTRDIDMLLKFVKDPDFQVLELEYYLESQILMAKNNLNSSVWLFEHALWMLHIMRLQSTCNQKRYVDAWSKVVLACSFELEHGSKIWKQSLQKNIQTQILMNSRGQQYFAALGEIYRVVEILRCSAIIYKPWILLNCEDSEKIYTCLRTCRGLWTDGGLRDALESIVDRLSNDFGMSVRTLLKSINSVGNLDEVALQNHMPDHDVPLCLSSLLSLKLIPEMKTIIWNGKHYFLALANFWANKISASPPHLSSAHVN